MVILLSSLRLLRGRGYKAAISRSVAQSGSAPRSGRGGRRFKSCHSDQLHTLDTDLPQLSVSAIELGGGRVHKCVHRRVLRMVSLGQDDKGNYKARKRLPDDIREEYGRLYGQRHVAKFHRPANTKPSVARQEYNEWLAEVEGRIGVLQAQLKGEGISLTHKQARALAGEWYDWFIARHPTSDKEHWEWVRDKVQDAMRDAVGDGVWEKSDPDELWQEEADLRKTVRPVLADAAETARFLAMKRQVLTNKARDQFLDFLYEDLAAALKRLMRHADGDYSPDKYRKRFPKFEGVDRGDTPEQLFERWVVEKGSPANTVETWKYVFREMGEHFKGRSAASITADEAQHWIKSLVTKERCEPSHTFGIFNRPGHH
jgi:hypothetical protein